MMATVPPGLTTRISSFIRGSGSNGAYPIQSILHAQSRLFVEYIVARDRKAFGEFLTDLLKGEKFGEAFNARFETGFDSFWSEFIKTTRKS